MKRKFKIALSLVLIAVVALLLAWRFIPVNAEKAVPRFDTARLTTAIFSFKDIDSRILYFEQEDPALDELRGILTKQHYYRSFYPQSWSVDANRPHGFSCDFGVSASYDDKQFTNFIFNISEGYVYLNGTRLIISKLSLEELMLDLIDFEEKYEASHLLPANTAEERSNP